MGNSDWRRNWPGIRGAGAAHSFSGERFSPGSRKPSTEVPIPNIKPALVTLFGGLPQHSNPGSQLGRPAGNEGLPRTRPERPFKPHLRAVTQPEDTRSQAVGWRPTLECALLRRAANLNAN